MDFFYDFRRGSNRSQKRVHSVVRKGVSPSSPVRPGEIVPVRAYRNCKTSYADEPIHPDTRRGRFIAPSADLSASVAIPLSGLFSKCEPLVQARARKPQRSVCDESSVCLNADRGGCSATRRNGYALARSLARPCTGGLGRYCCAVPGPRNRQHPKLFSFLPCSLHGCSCSFSDQG